MRGRVVSLLLLLLVSSHMVFGAKPGSQPPPGPEPDWEIVYVSSLSDRLELVLTIPDGSQKKTLHSVKNVSDVGPSFTPDGRHVVFTSNIGGVAGIYAIRLKDAAGQPSIGQPTLLATVGQWSRNCHPTVSAENILAFSDRPNGEPKGDVHLVGVFVDGKGDLRADPANPRINVTNTPDEYEVWPSWSLADAPSGRRLAFTNYTTLSTITCAGFDCSHPSPVALNLGPDLTVEGAAAWSKTTPGLIAFGCEMDPAGYSSDLCFMDLDEPVRQGKLTDTPGSAHEGGPTWQAGDNRLLAYASRDQNGLVIFEDILARMNSGPSGAETILAMPKTRRENYSEADWRR
jgi:hypothetical protein